MKKLLIIILCLLPLRGISQDPQLFEGPWMLEKIVINDFEYEAVTAEIIFNENHSTISHWYCFEDYTFGIEYTSSSSFHLTYEGTSGSTCEEPIEIYQKHFEFYMNENSLGNNPFTYGFTTLEDTQKLIITNNNGDQAHYLRMWIGVESVLSEKLVFYPNPVKDILLVQGIEANNIEKFEIFGFGGQYLLKQVENNTTIDLSFLSSGFYYLKLTTKNGKVKFIKFIKE